jgi:hypothetical protein
MWTLINDSELERYRSDEPALRSQLQPAQNAGRVSPWKVSNRLPEPKAEEPAVKPDEQPEPEA